jgi:hypoxanthine-guanine phosphoribosyltransferase
MGEKHKQTLSRDSTTMVRNIYLDYNDIALRLDALAPEILRNDFGALVIVLRGGSFAGLHMAFLTGLPYYFLRYDRKRAMSEWVGSAPTERRVLLCEDFAGMGRTLTDCRKFLDDLGYDVSTLVVCKDRFSAIEPDYYCFDCQDRNARFLLPWERYRINPETGATSMVEGRPDHEYERTAWDLDGVFLHDIDEQQYRSGLEEALALRDMYPLADFAPVPSIQDIVVTGRPVCDRDRTQEWLRKHKINIPVVLRDDGVEYPTAESVARWKGQRALELGCTHFVESDSAQALHIAALYPELRVIWWNQGYPMALQASKASFYRE